jgi:hypothetical protein
MYRLFLIVPLALAAPLAAQNSDSAYRGVQERGKAVMGVDQYTSRHRFEPAADGGSIVLVRDSTDTTGVATIRAHLQHIAEAFAGGDFTLPGVVHDREVPGTRIMAQKKTAIRYVYHPLAGGGEVRIVTRDAVALGAVHDFLAFQRMDHRAGMEGMTHH